MELIKIEVDAEVYDLLKKKAVPFEDFTPNDVLRKILKLPKLSEHKNLDTTTSLNKIHPAFLTFLLDKYLNTTGNFKTTDIILFMKKFSFITDEGKPKNPWMKNPYKNETSCKTTIEHFRQCRQFACWYGLDNKKECNFCDCKYHPKNNGNCSFDKEVIWKRDNPRSSYRYGSKYIENVKKYLLNNSKISIYYLLKTFYSDKELSDSLIEKFKSEFHFNNYEFNALFSLECVPNKRLHQNLHAGDESAI